MPDIAALVTPPLLLDSTGAPANGDIYARVTSSFVVGAGVITGTMAHGVVSEGQFKALDGSAFNLAVQPEGIGTELTVVLREERPQGQGQIRPTHVINRTVSVPNASTVAWDELIDMVPVVEGGDYIIPPWVAASLAASEIAVAAAAEAVAAAAAASSFSPTQEIIYDADGNVESVTEGGVTTTFTYNTAGNVETETRLGHVRTWTYDLDGNPVSSTVTEV